MSARSWIRPASGMTALALAAALYCGLARVPAENGWALVRWDGASVDDAPSLRTIVREPAEVEGPTRAPFVAEWSAWFKSEEGSYEFRADVDDELLLELDGKPILDARGASSRRVVGEGRRVTLAAGLHEVRVRLTEFGGGKCLRLYYDHLGHLEHSFLWMPKPWDLRATWPTKALAEAASPGPSDSARAVWFSVAMGLALAGALLLLCRRLTWREAGLVFAVAAAVFLIRVSGVGLADGLSDEQAYLRAGMLQVRNVALGDFSTESFRWNAEHPPISKWVYGVAELAGGGLGAKLAAAAVQALTGLFLFLIGRRFFSRAAGVMAALLFALSPQVVGHGRVVGLESFIMLFFTASVWALLVACESNRARWHFAWGLLSVLGLGSKLIAVWFAPVALTAFVVWAMRPANRPFAWRRLLPWAAAFAGAGAGAAAVFALWPWLWSDPHRIVRTMGAWGGVSLEWVLGRHVETPVWFFVLAFLILNPLGLLALGASGIWTAIRRPSLVGCTLVAWLVFPFAQSFFLPRLDGARYVIAAYPALTLLAAAGLERLVAWCHLRERRWAPVAARAAVLAYLLGCVARTFPYEIDFCSEAVGGTKGVVARRWLEIPFWGEGNAETVRWLNEHAPHGSVVYFHNDAPPRWTIGRRPPLRSDLVRGTLQAADFMTVVHFQYPPVPAGFEPAHSVRAGGGEIAGVYRRLADNPKHAR